VGERVGSFRYLRAEDRWELTVHHRVRAPLPPQNFHSDAC
jgi:hypothetical protein